MSERIVPVRVWDAPTRLFHWAIVILLGLSWLTESRGWMALHFLSGYSIIALLLFRVAWGFVGSETARFAHFVKSPIVALRQLARVRRRRAVRPPASVPPARGASVRARRRLGHGRTAVSRQ